MQCGLSIGVKEVYGLCSGGKDSMSACAIAHQYHPLDGIILVDTTIVARKGNHKPSYIAAKTFANKLNVPFICIKAKENLKKGFDYVNSIEEYGIGKVVENYVKKYGFPHRSNHNEVYRYLKEKALIGFVMSRTEPKQRIAYISGSRRNESERRLKNAQLIGIDDVTPRLIWIAPVYFWSTAEAFKYTRDNNYKISESYKTLHLSGDCLCGAFSKKGEENLIDMFYPDSVNQIVDLENVANKKHKGRKHWGNGESMKVAKSQRKLTETNKGRWICADCQI